jgi:transmembrane sensor
MKANFNMREKTNRITFLIEKVLEEKMTTEEEIELNGWLAESEGNSLLFKKLTNREILKEKLKIYSSTDSVAIWERTLEKICGAKVIELPGSKTLRIRRLNLSRWLGTFLANK